MNNKTESGGREGEERGKKGKKESVGYFGPHVNYISPEANNLKRRS